MVDLNTVLELNLNDVPDRELIPDGEEILMRIIRANVHEGQNSGKLSIRVILESPTDPSINRITHYLSLPNSEDDEDTAYGKRERVKRFCQAFDIPIKASYNFQDPKNNDFVMHEGYVIAGIEQDDAGEDRNFIRRTIKR